MSSDESPGAWEDLEEQIFANVKCTCQPRMVAPRHRPECAKWVALHAAQEAAQEEKKNNDDHL